MLRKVRSHGLDIDAHQQAELQLWLVHKGFRIVGRIYLRVYARVETDCVPRSTNAFTNLFSSIIKEIGLVHHTSFVTWHHKMDGKLHLSEKPISCFILFLAMLVLK